MLRRYGQRNAHARTQASRGRQLSRRSSPASRWPDPGGPLRALEGSGSCDDRAGRSPPGADLRFRALRRRDRRQDAARPDQVHGPPPGARRGHARGLPPRRPHRRDHGRRAAGAHGRRELAGRHQPRHPRPPAPRGHDLRAADQHPRVAHARRLLDGPRRHVPAQPRRHAGGRDDRGRAQGRDRGRHPDRLAWFGRSGPR